MIIVKGKPKYKNRARRKFEYITTKNMIRDYHKSEYGFESANFSTHHLLDLNDVDPVVKSWWCDVYFIDPKTKTVYNTTVLNAACYLNDSLESLNDKIMIEKGLLRADYEDYDILKGDKHFLSLLDDPENLVSLVNAEIDHDYWFGVGLTLVVPEEILTVENINNAIVEFLGGDYEAYRSVQFDKNHSVFDATKNYVKILEERNGLDQKH